MELTSLAAEVLKRKLPDAEIEPGVHHCRGTVVIEIDTIVTKREPSLAAPGLPWKDVVAVLASELGLDAEVIGKAARKAATAKNRPIMPLEVEAVLENVVAKLPAKEKAGATQIAGTVLLLGFVEMGVEPAHWADIKAELAKRAA